MTTGWKILLDPDSDAGGGTPSSVSDPVESAASTAASSQENMVPIPRAEYDAMQGRLTSAAGNDPFHERIRSAGITDFNTISDGQLKFLAAMEKQGFRDYDALGESLYPTTQKPYENGDLASPTAAQPAPGLTRADVEQMFAENETTSSLKQQHMQAMGLQDQGIAAIRKEFGINDDFSAIAADDIKGQMMNLILEGLMFNKPTGLISDENHPHKGQFVPMVDEQIGGIRSFFENMQKNLSAELQFNMAKESGGATPTPTANTLPAGVEDKIPAHQMTRAQLDEASKVAMGKKIDARRKASGDPPLVD